MSTYTLKIGGEAGFGIMSTGLTFSKIAMRSGFQVFDYAEYPSVIRGGHNVMQTSWSKDKVSSAELTVDILIALNQETLALHQGELKKGGLVLYEAAEVDSAPSGQAFLPVPFNALAREHGGSIIMRNTVALGAALYLIGGELKLLKTLITDEFGIKKPEMAARNIKAAEAGYVYAKEHFFSQARALLAPIQSKVKQILVNGNEAVALGALAGGVQFASIYPMTPTSYVLQILADLEQAEGLIYKQPEDEISAINMAIGASFAGARSMVATAGGGFCLMTEGYGLAGMTETPLVIIEGMRGSPATGLPTWTEQGDLRFVLHAHQGDFPRIVLAAGDAEEAFYLTREAFNLADKYQTPVVVMVDKLLCESHESVPVFEKGSFVIDRGKFSAKKIKDFARYAFSPDGISTRSIPGVGNHVVGNSDEHDPQGYSNEESGNRVTQMDKRMEKLNTCTREDMAPPKLYGKKFAPITIVSWGSTKGAILSALPELPEANYLHLTWLNPFPTKEVLAVLKQAKRVIVIEGNFSGQLAGLVAEKTGVPITHQLLKYDGRPFYTEEIKRKVDEVYAALTHR